MKVTLFTLLVAAQGLLATALPAGDATGITDAADRGTGDVTTIDIASGHGATGTIVANTSKATQYLLDDAGIDVAKFLGYIQNLPTPEHGVEYPFPAGSGLEGSHIVFDGKANDVLPVNDKAAARPGNMDINCDKCWTACIYLSWFPPAWAICSKCFEDIPSQALPFAV